MKTLVGFVIREVITLWGNSGCGVPPRKSSLGIAKMERIRRRVYSCNAEPFGRRNKFPLSLYGPGPLGSKAVGGGGVLCLPILDVRTALRYATHNRHADWRSALTEAAS